MNKKYDKKIILFLLLAPFFLFLFSGVAEAATLGWIGNEGVGMRIANNWKTTDVLDYLSGLNRTNFRALSKSSENWLKMSFRPRRNGLFSNSEKAHVILRGSAKILTVMALICALTGTLPIPKKLICSQSSKSIFNNSAMSAGITEASAPMSTRKSKFWYPNLVKTGSLISGSGRAPHQLGLSPNENSPCINARVFRRNVTKCHGFTKQASSFHLTKEFAQGVGMRKHSSISVNDVLTAVSILKFNVGNLWFHSDKSIPLLAGWCQ